MNNPAGKLRQIALFVEGHSERGNARQKTLPVFFHKWLDPQLPEGAKVGITAVRFQGVSNYLDRLPRKLEFYLDQPKAASVFGLVDLYGFPPDRLDLSRYATIAEKVEAARATIRDLIPQRLRNRFRQHFAVHELEAWMLAYPEKWPADVRDQITKRPPEEINFDEPPAKLLKKLLGKRYKKTVSARRILPSVDPQTAIDKCPYLRRLADDLLDVARRLV